MLHSSEVSKLRHKILITLTKMTLSGELKNNAKSILNTVILEEGPRYRCCVYKERAVLKDRLKVFLDQSEDIGLQKAADNALAGKCLQHNVVKVVPLACDQCPIDKFLVTNACRNCLAHNCMNNCPRDAIMIVQNRAYIDKTKCVECGLCKKSCQYSAIIEVSRPCESACALGAITAGSNRKAVINYDKCVQCGSCKVACPFGAIEETSNIVQLIQALKNGERIYAMLAPSHVSQFGVKVTSGQLVSALKKMGLYDIKEVAYGADIVSIEDGKEFIQKVPHETSFLTSSCCPAFVSMIEKMLPEIKNHVSSVVSPMIAMGKLLKAHDTKVKILFVGPCTAKKGEAKKYEGIIDYVVTFEELDCLFKGYGIDVATESESAFGNMASKTAHGFVLSGGVATAVGCYVKEMAPDKLFEACHVAGLESCKNVLTMIEKGALTANFVEGMACPAGCVGGPGTLANANVAGKFIDCATSTILYQSAKDNTNLEKIMQEYKDWHVKD